MKPSKMFMLQTTHTHTHLAMLAGAAFFAGQAAATNLVTNGSFEPDATGWTGAGTIYSHPYAGLSGIQLAGSGGAQAVADTGNFDFDSLRYGYYDDLAMSIGAKFHGLSGGSQIISQASLTAAASVEDIDAGRAAMGFSSWMSSYKGDGNTPAIRVRFFSGDGGTGTVLGTQTLDRGTTTNQVETAQHLATGNYLNGAEDSRTDPDYWALYKVKTGLPPGTRSMIVDIIAGTGHVASGSNDWYVDAVVVDVTVVPFYHWTGLVGGEWSTAVLPDPKNWEVLPSPGTAADYIDGVPVQFDDLGATGNIQIPGGGVAPQSINFSNATTAYNIGGTGPISGTTGIYKTGAASLTLAIPNTYTGMTNINGGTLVLDHTLAVQNSTVSITDGLGSLSFGTPTAFTLGGLSGTGAVALQNAGTEPVTLTVGNGGSSSVFGGTFSGSGALVKTGGGTFELQNASTLTAASTLAGGWVSMKNPGALGTGDIVSTGGGLLFGFGSGTTSEISNNITLPAAGRQMFQATGNPAADVVVTLSGKLSGGTAGQVYRFADTDTSGNHHAVLRLTNPANDFQGDMEMWRGTLEFTSDAALGNPSNGIHHFTENLSGVLRFGADNITLNPNRTIQFYTNTASMPIDTQAYTATIAGNFSGIGNFVKLGTGRLILTGTNNATGITTVTGGSLEVDGTFATGDLVTVGAAGTLTGTGSIQRSITLQGTLAPGNGAGTLASNGVLTLADNAVYQCQIADWTGTAGTGFDQVTAGSIAITATSAAPVKIVVTPASLAHFSTSDRRFTIATGTNAASGFDAAAFTVDATAMPTTIGTWSVELEGNNLVLVYSLGSAGYEGWITAKGLTGGDAATDADPDHDGVSNLLEFLYGTEPNPANAGSNSADKGPMVASVDATTLHFVFRQSAMSNGKVTPQVLFSNDLSTWFTPAEFPGYVTTTVEPNGFGAGVDKVTVDLSREISPDKLFVTLKAVETAP
ncbi:MAG: autotransporter-associated beta strand repeat-containing protein [Luteolibacter sp.]